MNEHWIYCDIETNEVITVLLYPNPATESLMLIPSKEVTVSVFSVLGVFIEQFVITNESIWNCSHLPDGVYIMYFENSESNLTKKLIIRNH